MDRKLDIVSVEVKDLKPSTYNPRTWSKDAIEQLKKSITKFGLVDPILANGAPNRKNIVIGGHFRLRVAKDLGYKSVPVVYVSIPDLKREKELNLRLNKNTGDWDWDLLANFSESFLSDAGFNSEDLDEVFGVDDNPEQFDLQKELAKLDIKNISVQKGDATSIATLSLMAMPPVVEKKVVEKKETGSSEEKVKEAEKPNYLLKSVRRIP